MTRISNLLLGTLLLFPLTFAGCGDPGIGAIPVSGTVTVDGTAMEGVMVVYTPADGSTGRAASGRTDAEGKYTLTTEINGDGAIPGEYKIAVTKHENAEDDLPKEVDPDDPDSLDNIYGELDTSKDEKSKNMIHAQYENPLGSGLSATVTDDESKNVFDFDVKGR
ncbi:MAG TPA: hypothetical protein DDW52_02055 [Planctomycetaceae bacterium]|nr:hypothetical protein [Planctomycetaceae bacterium]